MPQAQRSLWFWLLLAILLGAILLVIMASRWGCSLWPTAAPASSPTAIAPAPTGAARLLTAVPTPSRSPTPLPTYAVVVTLGQVRHAITGRPVANARLYAGFNTATTDAQGRFRIASSPDSVIRATAPGFEEGQAHPQSDTPVAIRLAPDPQTTLALLHDFERQGDYGRQYDLLHPDIQALFTREEYISYMQRTVNYEIVSTSYGEATRLATWTYLDRTYFDVAEVPVQMVVWQDGQQRSFEYEAHLAPWDGIWRWFRSPLEQPTATPRPTSTSSPTTIPSPTATFEPGGYPYGTRVEVFGTDKLNLRYGPGPEYAAVTSVPRGEVLVVLEGPRFVEQAPWYRVQQVATGTVGWVNGNYLRPVLPPPTKTPTRTPTSTQTPPPYPIGSQVMVISATPLYLRSGAGVTYPVIGQASPGSTLIIRSAPVYVDTSPWYLMEDTTGLLGWANGQYVQPVPTATPTITLTPTVTPTPTTTFSPTPTRTRTLTPTVTQTPIPTATWTPSLTPTTTPSPTATSTSTPTATDTPFVTATPITPGTRVEVASPDDLRVRRGPGVGFPVVATVPPGSILVILDGPIYINDEPWYEVAYEGESPLGWAEGLFLQPVTD